MHANTYTHTTHTHTHTHTHTTHNIHTHNTHTQLTPNDILNASNSDMAKNSAQLLISFMPVHIKLMSCLWLKSDLCCTQQVKFTKVLMRLANNLISELQLLTFC